VSEEDAPTPEQRSFFERFRDRLSGRQQKAAGLPGVLIKLLGNRETASIKRDSAAYLKAFNELPWLRTTVTKIANSMAANDWEILKVTTVTDETGETRVVEEEPNELLPIHNFLNNPNPQFSFAQLVWLITIYLELVGEAFLWMVPINGEVNAYPIPPDKVVRTPTFEDPYYHISGPQGEYSAGLDEIVVFMHPDPVDPYSRGVGLAQSLSHDLDTDDAASRYTLSHFNNSARPELLVFGEGLNAERAKQMEDDWNQQHMGFWNAGKTRFLSRKVEIKEISQKFEGTDIVNLRQHQRDVVASVMGVPPEILGILQASNRATIDAADLFFSRYTLKPRLDFLQEVFNKQLMPRFDDTGTVVMKFINPTQKDKETILKAARFMPSALSINDWRELMEFDPLDGDEGDCYLVPLNMQVLSKLKGGVTEAGPPQAVGSPAVPSAPSAPKPTTPAAPGETPAPTPAAEPAAAASAAYGELETKFGTLKGRKVKHFKDLK
jgi:HK97 family phage portal protein